jgi:hypothetical protein
MEWAPIRYRDFYDVPRIFILKASGDWLLFDCPFDEATDEYHDDYAVYLLEATTAAALDGGAWPSPASTLKTPIATVPVSAVTFDPTRRHAVRGDLLSRIGRALTAAKGRVPPVASGRQADIGQSPKTARCQYFAGSQNQLLF